MKSNNKFIKFFSASFAFLICIAVGTYNLINLIGFNSRIPTNSPLSEFIRIDLFDFVLVLILVESIFLSFALAFHVLFKAFTDTTAISVFVQMLKTTFPIALFLAILTTTTTEQFFILAAMVSFSALFTIFHARDKSH